jgi:hypothetical protein
MESTQVRHRKLRELIDSRHEGNQAKFCAAVGISRSQVGQWLGGYRNMSDTSAREIEAKLGLPRLWIDGVSGIAAMAGIKTAATGADVIEVPLMSASPSMGYGGEHPERGAVIDAMRLSVAWARQNLPAITGLHNLNLLVAYGDSMEPTFADGDLLLIDAGVRDVTIDAVFVLSLDGNLFAKRLQRRPDGSVSMISDNKLYDTIVINDGGRQQFEVMGRVVWSWRGKKM